PSSQLRDRITVWTIPSALGTSTSPPARSGGDLCHLIDSCRSRAHTFCTDPGDLLRLAERLVSAGIPAGGWHEEQRGRVAAPLRVMKSRAYLVLRPDSLPL